MPPVRDGAAASGRNSGAIDEVEISQLLRGYRDGALRCVDVVAHYLTRIHERTRNGQHGGILALNPSAQSEAERLDREYSRTGKLSGALHGVPIVIKDQFEVAGMPACFGSAAVRSYRPPADAALVARLRRAGALVLAKSTMADFGLSLFSRSSQSGYTVNPYDPTRDTGGSSSGSAAAVADNLCAAGIGEDTSGSVRLPASFTGLVGLRPTPGLLPTAGASPVLRFQDSPGPLTRTVADAALIFEAVVPAGAATAGRLVETLGSRTDRVPQVGILRVPFEEFPDADAVQVRDLMAAAMLDLRRCGISAEDVPMPRPPKRRTKAHAAPIIQRQLQEFFNERPELAGASLERIVGVGSRGADLIGLLRAPAANGSAYGLLMERVRLRAGLIKAMRHHGVDVLCYPTAALPAPRLVDLESGRWHSRNFPSFTWLAGQAGLPAITVPAGFTHGGLPVGVEFLGLPYSERGLIRLAHRYERATRHRRPPHSVSSQTGDPLLVEIEDRHRVGAAGELDEARVIDFSDHDC